MRPKIGEKAPEIITINQSGENVKLSDLLGKKVVVYFYPKDNTPTCTTQACNLRDNYADLSQHGFTVIGISIDPAKSHQKFVSKFELPFDLWVDEDLKIVNDYGVWVEKQMYGKKYMGTERVTFVIDEKGFISNVIEKVESKNHSAQILQNA
jgi:thioredoxin-dependent peroxiredoxin